MTLENLPPLAFEDDNTFFDFPAFRDFCLNLSSRGAILADRNVLEKALALQEALGPAFPLIPLSGEKTRAAKEAVEDELLKRGLGRDSLLLGMGGGSATDLAGYVASTYRRGIPLALLPTTLLAMVDAAIGGKNGIDTPFGKNQIGTFHFPKALFIDPRFLCSLPDKEWLNGLAEILKYGLTLEPEIWERIEHCPFRWKEEHLDWLIRVSSEAKKKVVRQDPYETKGYRRVLNFGHTVGHALELLSDFSMDHGQAVAAGSAAESYLSYRLGFLSSEMHERILHLYRKLGFALKLPHRFSSSSFKQALAMDKKSAQSKPRCVLIDGLGSTVPFDGAYCRPLEENEIDDLIGWMKETFDAFL